jgi:hypothetical protein
MTQRILRPAKLKGAIPSTAASHDGNATRGLGEQFRQGHIAMLSIPSRPITSSLWMMVHAEAGIPVTVHLPVMHTWQVDGLSSIDAPPVQDTAPVISLHITYSQSGYEGSAEAGMQVQ